MSRCIICDNSTDTGEGGPSVRMNFNKEAGGYICEDCNYEVYSSIEELEQRDREIALASEENRPEVSGGGAQQGLPFGISPLRQEEEDYSLPVQLVQNPSTS